MRQCGAWRGILHRLQENVLPVAARLDRVVAVAVDCLHQFPVLRWRWINDEHSLGKCGLMSLHLWRLHEVPSRLGLMVSVGRMGVEVGSGSGGMIASAKEYSITDFVNCGKWGWHHGWWERYGDDTLVRHNLHHLRGLWVWEFLSVLQLSFSRCYS